MDKAEAVRQIKEFGEKLDAHVERLANTQEASREEVLALCDQMPEMPADLAAFIESQRAA